MKNAFYFWIYLSSVSVILLTFSCQKDKNVNDNENQPPVADSVYDIDGNLYHTVTIGTQTWMVENLKVTKYRNGDPIPHVTDQLWFSLYSGAYCDYDNNSNYADSYGRLYNWYAVKDSRNIAPVGWRVPTNSDWNKLTLFLGNGNSVIAGGAMKETGTIHWKSPNTDATNKGGFTALPGGARYYFHRAFGDVSVWCYFWSSSELNPGAAWYRSLYYNSSDITNTTFFNEKQNGFSVRCVKD